MWILVLVACTPTSPQDREWVGIEGGSFTMGNAAWPNASPPIEVTVPDFQIMRHEVLASDFQACVEAKACEPITAGCAAHSAAAGLPASCLNWGRARQVCAWKQARLPTEAEWEYAASSRGTVGPYPWGPEEADCTRANFGVKTRRRFTPSCGDGGLWKVCTHPAGNTPLGLCEMGGNVFEWLEDHYAPDYTGWPRNGSANRGETDLHSLRGGSIGSLERLDIPWRTHHRSDFEFGGMGVRCARDAD